MRTPNIVSVTYSPRYKVIAGQPVVQDAGLRVLWDNNTISLETISASAYEDATHAESAALSAALDAHREA